jgi:hypothetical protein
VDNFAGVSRCYPSLSTDAQAAAYHTLQALQFSAASSERFALEFTT